MNYTLKLQELDCSQLALAGAKAANLGELTRLEGLHIPQGFCLTTEAYPKIAISGLEELAALRPDQREAISQTCSRIRSSIQSTPLPDQVAEEIYKALEGFAEGVTLAVRSSATAEDLPAASFAGQQDSYLDLPKDLVLEHISKCWASLFSDRAVIYRMQNGFDHSQVALAVVVQAMVSAEVSGVMFTADPVSGNRKVISIEAAPGLGEALVSGLVRPDGYKVREQQVIEKVGEALSPAQILRLAALGRRIEAHFGAPQDIEWCLCQDTFYILQSRPITSLFPLPEVNDENNHVYVSVGHQQMMTDAMTPLGLSVWQHTAARPMLTAGGRLFVDLAPDFASPARRNVVLNVLGKGDPLMREAFLTLVERDFIPLLPEEPAGPPPPNFQQQIEYDPQIVPELIARSQASLAALSQNIRAHSGPELIDFILEELHERRKGIFDPRSFAVIVTAMNAATWLNEKMEEWLGEKNVADILTQSVPGNVTSQMGLDLMALADTIRPYPEVIAYLQQTHDKQFLLALPALAGGQEVSSAIRTYLDRYGMRCAGEIDITRPRWSESPLTLVSAILSNLRNFEPGAGQRRFDQGREQALKKEQELLQRLRVLPEGESKAAETLRMIELVRNYAGYREYPKYDIVNRYFIFKQALLRATQGLFPHREDMYYLRLEELREVLATRQVDTDLIGRRKDDFKVYAKLTPPRVMTSDGEIIRGHYKRSDLPEGAIAGLAVSSGLVEGRARVILNMENADLSKDDILVTTFTDPSWTPLFVSIKGLVTEVGGLMTHGAVIAREYGLPAVVGVENATRLIKDGQRIRVHGSEGYVELLDDLPGS
jgi:phosphoenolpyruvate synthase/pyruvate phosphate dikinase